MFTKNQKVLTTPQRYTCFTLAEVLLALMIVGIVAVMTIPSLMNYAQDLELKASFKKDYADISNAFNQMKNDEAGGDFTNFCANDSSYPNWSVCYFSKLSKYLSTQKVCLTGSSPICWYSNSNNSIKYYNSNCGTNLSCLGTLLSYNSLILSDGALVSFGGSGSQSSSCNIYFFDNSTSNRLTINNVCFPIAIDVNGHNPPNQLGRDVYFALLTSNGVTTPTYASSDQCTKSVSSTGITCSTKVLGNIDY